MANQKLLIVDDDENYSRMMVDFFKMKGYEISFANNLEDAINLFRKHRPKVVLLDFNMPIVTGEKFLPILQSVDPMIRVIVISGCTEEEVEDKFRGLGYFAFFEKGAMSLEAVREKVDEALTY
jgi:DNA-binding NtrC family response regulator